MANGRKQVSFDLDTKALEKYYPFDSWHNSYDVIKRHMQNNGFVWQQGSVYISQNPTSSRDVSIMIETMIEKHQWLNVCMRDCVVTNIGREHSQNHLFNKEADVPMREDKKSAANESRSTLNDYKAQIKKKREEAAPKMPEGGSPKNKKESER